MLGKYLSVAALVSLACVGVAATQSVKPTRAPATTVASSATYDIDDVHSSALFRVQHAGAGQFWGRFTDVDGTMSFDAANAPTGFDITISIESVDSGEPKLDGHLKSPDFFNVKEFPSMTFRSTGLKKGANGMFEATGDLTMHGVTKPITSVIEVTGMADMGMGARAGVEATFSVKRSDFGMNYGVEKGMIGDVVKVIVNLEGVKAKA